VLPLSLSGSPGISRRYQKRGRRARKTRALLTFERLEGRWCPSDFYTYTLIAKTGQQDQKGATLTGIAPDPSINDAGQVAFVGDYANGQGILVGDGNTLTNINPSFSHTANRTFSPFVEINNSNQVAAIDRYAGDASSYLRTWSTTTDSHQDDAIGGEPSSPFDAILASPAINDSGLTIFPASQSGGANQPDTVSLNEHAAGDAVNTVTPLPIPPLTSPQALRPQVDENGDVVVQEGNSAISPIVLYENTQGGAFVRVPIAQTGVPYRFSALGQSPGISDDGQIVVFYGIDANGPGIFASVNTTSH
jgi:hypothetical protein